MNAIIKKIKNLEDIIIIHLLERYSNICEEKRQNELRSQCYCDDEVQLLDTARIINEKNRNSIRIKKGSVIRGEIHTYGIKGKISIGEDCYVGEGTRIWSAGEIQIGNRVMIGHNCNIIDNNTHPLDSEKRNKQFHNILKRGQPRIDLKEKKITICDDAWIAANCIVLKGITIGKGSIVGIGTMVTCNIPDNCIAYGNPIKIRKFGE